MVNISLKQIVVFKHSCNNSQNAQSTFLHPVEECGVIIHVNLIKNTVSKSHDITNIVIILKLSVPS